MMPVVHRGLDVIGGELSFLRMNGSTFRIGFQNLGLSRFLHPLLISLVFCHPFPDLFQLLGHVFRLDIHDGRSFFFLIRLVHSFQIFFNSAFLLLRYSIFFSRISGV